MLDAYIIEELKRQEEARRRAEDEARRPRVHIERSGDPEQPEADPDADPETDPPSEDPEIIRI